MWVNLSFTVTLLSDPAPSYASLGYPYQATGTILDDDQDPNTLYFYGTTGDDVVDVYYSNGEHYVMLNGDRTDITNPAGVAAIHIHTYDGNDEVNQLVAPGDESTIPLEIFGGPGNDLITGGNAADLLDGEDGDDLIYGGLGDDVLTGGLGNNTLDAGKGMDTLDGVPEINTPPAVTGGIDDVHVAPDAASTLIDLFPAFEDAQDLDSEMTFIVTVTDNNNPALFESVDIDLLTGVLTLDYSTDGWGMADLTVEATDSLGLSVETSFEVWVTDYVYVELGGATECETISTIYYDGLPPQSFVIPIGEWFADDNAWIAAIESRMAEPRDVYVERETVVRTYEYPTPTPENEPNWGDYEFGTKDYFTSTYAGNDLGTCAAGLADDTKLLVLEDTDDDDYDDFYWVVTDTPHPLNVDIDTDSDNDGIVEQDGHEDGIEETSPGKYLSTLSGAARAQIAMDESYSGGFSSGDTATLWSPYNNAGLTVWDSLLDGNLVPFGTQWDLTTEVVPDYLYVEAATAGEATVQLLLLDATYAEIGRDEVCFTALAEQIVDLQIWDGQYRVSYGMASETVDWRSGTGKNGDEWDRGAFTVVNWNDTDGDGRKDSSDTTVKQFSHEVSAQDPTGTILTLASVEGLAVDDLIVLWTANYEWEWHEIKAIDATNKKVTLDEAVSEDMTGGTLKHRGQDEVDLMRMLIVKPNPATGGNVTLRTNSDQVRLWADSTKTTPILLTNKQVSTPVTQIPAGGSVVWVEIIGKIDNVRDIEFELEYKNVSDWVRATGVWAEVVDTEQSKGILHDRGDEPWSDMTPPTDTMSDFGLLAFSDRPNTFANGIGIQFTVGPVGIVEETAVKFDITRQIERRIWERVVDGGQWNEAKPVAFRVNADVANDDKSDDHDESASPNENLHMYSTDTAGFLLVDPTVVSGGIYQMNASEWVRVAFGGTEAEGDGLRGSRASDFCEWHSRTQWELDEQGAPKRSPASDQETDENDIGPGHVEIQGP